jgi:hypothetical protein
MLFSHENPKDQSVRTYISVVAAAVTCGDKDLKSLEYKRFDIFDANSIYRKVAELCGQHNVTLEELGILSGVSGNFIRSLNIAFF